MQDIYEEVDAIRYVAMFTTEVSYNAWLCILHRADKIVMNQAYGPVSSCQLPSPPASEGAYDIAI